MDTTLDTVRQMLAAQSAHRAALTVVDATTPGTPERMAAINALVAAEDADRAAFRAFRRAMDASGVRPCDRAALVASVA